MFLPSHVGASFPEKASNNSVDELSASPSSFPSRRVLSSWLMLRSTIIFFCPFRGLIASPHCLFPPWGPFRTSVLLHKPTEVPDFDKVLNFILERLAFLSGMSTVSMILTSTSLGDIYRTYSSPMGELSRYSRPHPKNFLCRHSKGCILRMGGLGCPCAYPLERYPVDSDDPSPSLFLYRCLPRPEPNS